MSAILEFLQNAVITVSRFGKQIFNLVGIFFLFYTGIHCIFIWIKEKDEVADDLFEGISTALTFLLIGEIFHSIILTDLASIKTNSTYFKSCPYRIA